VEVKESHGGAGEQEVGSVVMAILVASDVIEPKGLPIIT
jgi:hypothetical protein